MGMKKLLLLCLLPILSQTAFSQLDVPVGGTSSLITFSSTVSGVNEGTFTGSGLASAPTSGRLDSDGWRITGMSDGSSSFGGSFTTGDFARGADNPADGVTTGGLYAFTVSGNVFLGIQPGGSDFTPGTLTLRVTNNTGGPIEGITVSYDVLANNDEARANSLNFSTSTDDATYTPVASLNFTSPVASTGSPDWSSTNRSATINLGSTVTDGGTFYLQWSGNDVSGSGSRDEFGIDNIQITSVLPINLVSFFGKQENNFVALQWQTASEINNHFMAVERSNDGARFHEIGRVNGAGTTNEIQNYNFIDELPLPGLNYYRLRQVDFDGATDYSKVVVVDFRESDKILDVRPTETADWITIGLQDSNSNERTLQVFDLAGRRLYEVILAAEESSLELNVANYPVGQYIVRLLNGGDIQTNRFFKR